MDSVYTGKSTSLVIPGTLSSLPKEATYEGNKTIKRAGVQIGYEPWQVEEIIKCANDIEYFAENYVYIVDPNVGKTLIKLRDYQKGFLKHIFNNRFSVILASRQVGKSMCVAICILHYVLFNRDKNAAIVANKASIAKEIFAKIRVAYERLPFWLQVGVVVWQQTSCTLENGSRVFSEATTADGLRGLSCSFLMLDEFAFIRRGIADEFFASTYPTISASKESKIVVVSTPKGMNHFYQIYDEAVKKKSGFRHYRVDWWQVPGRDEKWKDETIKNIGPVRFAQEYGNDFANSSYTLIPSRYLTAMDARVPEKEGNLLIYERPKKNHKYPIGVDTSKGTGKDYSVAQILDVTSFPVKQVAMYRSNDVETRKYAIDVESIAKHYNMASVLIENNDIGATVSDYFWNDAEYENLVNFGGKREIGIRSTNKSKKIAVYWMRELIQEGKLQIVDKNTIYELSKFVEVTDGVFKAEEKEHDDCVTSLFWATFILKTNYLDNDLGQEKDVDESPPSVYFDDGIRKPEDQDWDWLLTG